jgi:ASC-1-like (ASCH) protein
MSVHELKSWPEFFEAVQSGTKKYEVRTDDRGYARGDRLLLHEWDPKDKEFTGRFCEVGVVHISHAADLRAVFSDFPNVCVMGIEVLA